MSAEVMTMGNRFVPAGENLALGRLLDTEEVKQILKPLVASAGREIRSCRIGHVRYHPFTGCTVSYRMKYNDRADDSVDTLEGSFYAKCCSPNIYNKLKETIPAETLCVPEWQTFFFQFPNDLRIPSLRLLADQRLLQETLSPIGSQSGGNGSIHLRPLRYKPESRLVAKCFLSKANELPSYVLRFDRPGGSRQVFDVINRLRVIFADKSGIDFPKPLFINEEHGLTAFEIIQGSKLSDLLSEEEAERHVRRTARTLSLLHSCADPELPPYRPSSHQVKSDARAALLSYSGEQIAVHMAAISDQLKPLAASINGRELTLVHGDFHQGQLLRSGEKDWIIDMDRSGLGDPIADLGNFVAQLTVLRLREKLPTAKMLIELFLEAYQEARPKRVPSDRLKFWIVQGLLELAAKDFRRLKPNWPVSVPAILDEIQDVLDR